MPRKLTPEQLMVLQSNVGKYHIRSLGVNFYDAYDVVAIHLLRGEAINDALTALREVFPDIDVARSVTFSGDNVMCDAFTAYTNGKLNSGVEINFYETYEKTPDVVRTPEEQENLLADSTTEWDPESIMRQEG